MEDDNKYYWYYVGVHYEYENNKKAMMKCYEQSIKNGDTRAYIRLAEYYKSFTNFDKDLMEKYSFDVLKYDDENSAYAVNLLINNYLAEKKYDLVNKYINMAIEKKWSIGYHTVYRFCQMVGIDDLIEKYLMMEIENGDTHAGILYDQRLNQNNDKYYKEAKNNYLKKQSVKKYESIEKNKTMREIVNFEKKYKFIFAHDIDELLVISLFGSGIIHVSMFCDSKLFSLSYDEKNNFICSKNNALSDELEKLKNHIPPLSPEEIGAELYELACEYRIKKKYGKMKKLFLMAIIKYRNVDAVIELGNYHYYNDNFDLMKYYYNSALHINNSYKKVYECYMIYYMNNVDISEIKKNDKIISMCMMASKMGIIDGMIILADVYKFTGDILKTIEYLKMAIEHGSDKALSKIIFLFEENKNYDEMIKYCMISIEKKNSDIMTFLGNYYKSIKNIEEMKKYYLMAIDKGDYNAKFSLSIHYYREIENYDEMKKIILNDYDKPFRSYYDNKPFRNYYYFKKNLEKYYNEIHVLNIHDIEIIIKLELDVSTFTEKIFLQYEIIDKFFKYLIKNKNLAKYHNEMILYKLSENGKLNKYNKLILSYM
jgi:hypothetical protein